MKPEGLLQFSRQQVTGPFLDQDESSSHRETPFLYKIHFNSMFPSRPRSSKWLLPFKSSN